ncbi:ACP S-malonyltransferase [Streptomyces diastatochromogenes]|nr:ACP S-malonyltransferase [Streptomyces diastatochromogenes]
MARDVDDLIGQLRRILAGEHEPADGSPPTVRPRSPSSSPARAASGPACSPTCWSPCPSCATICTSAAPTRHPVPARRLRRGRPRTPPGRPHRHPAAQPALGITGLAAHAFLTAAGIRPDLAAGHSYGELVALSAAGALDPETLLELSAERASAIPGGRGRRTRHHGRRGSRCRGRRTRAARRGAPESVVVANHNSPEQSVISGPTAEVETAVGLLREAGLGARRIPVACAFHSPVVAAAGERFAKVLADKTVRAPEFPVWANRTAAPYPHDGDAVRGELAAQIGAPVAFAAQIEAMYEAGARIFVEAGPGTVLTRLVGQILGDRPHRAVACEPRADSGLPGWLDALAHLALAGLPVRTAWLLRGRDAVDALRTPAPRRPG